MKRAILENERVEDFSADHAAPPREGRHAGTDLQIHERLFHHQIVTAWASHHKVGFCRTPTHASPFEATARSLPHAPDASRGSGDVLALTHDEPPVGAGMCYRGSGRQPDLAPSRDQEGRLASASRLVSAWPAAAAAIVLSNRRSQNSNCRGSPLVADHER